MSPPQRAGPRGRRPSARLFVSSTFADLRNERDALVRSAFPALRSYCATRGIRWNEIDLRWGIDAEAVAENRALPICFAEIDAARPLFIAVLGERYGWVPEALPDDLVVLEPWLEGFAGRSITELEIRHGILNNPSGGVGFVYVKNGDPAERSDEPMDDRLEALRSEIGAAGIPMRSFRSPEELAELVVADFEPLIERLFPSRAVDDPTELESYAHHAFSILRAEAYVPADGMAADLEKTVGRLDGGLLLTGLSGSGMSSLLSYWAERIREGAAEPKPPAIQRIALGMWGPWRPTADRSFFFFAEASEVSRDWMELARYVAKTLLRAAGGESGVGAGTTPDEVRARVAVAFHSIAAQGPALIVIDGLDHLADLDSAHHLHWLPDPLPRGLRLVVSASAEVLVEELRRRRYEQLAVRNLDEQARRTIATNYLAGYGKVLPAVSLDRIASLVAAENPLSLILLLNELRVFGSHEHLDAHIERYSDVRNTEDLFDRVLDRLERDFNPYHEGLVGSALSAIVTSRRGLDDGEIRGVVGESGRPLPASLWSSLRHSLGEVVDEYAGVVGLTRRSLRRVVERRYLSNRSLRLEAHRRLMRFFGTFPVGPRFVEEHLFQASRADDDSALLRGLTDPESFTLAWRIAREDVLAYWSQLEQRGHDAREACAYLEERGATPQIALGVGTLLLRLGYAEDAVRISGSLIRSAHASSDPSLAPEAAGLAALALRDVGRLEESLQRLQEQQQLTRESGEHSTLATCLSNLGVVLADLGRYEDALGALDEADGVLERSGVDKGRARIRSHKTRVRIELGDSKRAIIELKDQERVARATGDLLGLQVALANAGVVLAERGKRKEALRYASEAELVAKTLGDRQATQASLLTQAELTAQGQDLDGALEILKQQLQLATEMESPSARCAGLMATAAVYTNAGWKAGAAQQMAKALELCAEHGLPRELEGLKRLQNRMNWNQS